MSGDEDLPDDGPDEENLRDDEPDDPAEGYAWGFARQEREIAPEEYRLHMDLLDKVEEEDLEALDLSRASDYLLWGAAQAFEDLERHADAIALMKRIAASPAQHPALDYPAILICLADRLKERGDYDDAAATLARAREIDPGAALDCDERTAEILVLRGRTGEGLALFDGILRDFPGDPWIPLRAAWALIVTGKDADLPRWIERAERALRSLQDEGEARTVASEIDRLRLDAEARRERRARLAAEGTGPVPGLERDKDEILGELDAEEARLTEHPPRTGDAVARATERLTRLQARASHAWDEAVVARDEKLIGEFDELRWSVVGLAERFGIDLPEEPAS